MPRKPRLQAPDILYHITSRGVEKRDIFLERKTYVIFLEMLEQTVFRYRWICHAYCLMKNHFHLAVETPLANISVGMQFLKGEYASWFNTAYGREGTLYERRFRDRTADDDAGLLQVSRYVALNPVYAAFRDRPEEWPWSSYNATIGLVRRPRFLTVDPILDLLGGGSLGAARFAEFVEEGMPPSHGDMSRRDVSGSDPNGSEMDMAA